ncbi:peptide chain release factor N(5)-glutamine methyltransferase [Desulfovibrio aminophilus]|nr:peptide chain release factor N(5)-glutamine methyltransferase [Desulfovibrio aminophilus]MCM0756274.1 peptide chain release factor N(5)-glutamine methyltransferase [Desulfovibrio aminophilus]
MTGPTVREILGKSQEYLAARGVDSPRLSAELLLAEVLGLDRLHLFLNMDRPLAADELARAREFMARRGRGEPAALILGRKEFWGLEFAVRGDVLVPRPETECIVEEAGNRFPGDAALTIVDLGTGSGCLAVTLALHFSAARVAALDLSPAALAVARENVLRHDVAGRVALVLADAGACPLVGAGADLVVANPPYISDGEYAALSNEVRDFEPALALCGGADGLDQVRAQAPEAARILRPGGMLLMEIGCGQGAAVRALFEGLDVFDEVAILRDLAGLDRVLLARRR